MNCLKTNYVLGSSSFSLHPSTYDQNLIIPISNPQSRLFIDRYYLCMSHLLFASHHYENFTGIICFSYWDKCYHLYSSSKEVSDKV